MLNESSHLGGPDRGPYIAEQHWLDLAFLHWTVAHDAIERRLPPGLILDVFDDQAWVGIVPFRLQGLHPLHLPGVPTATDFLELNVRTYVRAGGKPGVYFFSLDASSTLAVAGARTLFGLPYHRAEMSCTREPTGEWLRYTSRRIDGAAAFDARYRPVGFAEQAAPGSLEEFLAERYRLFNARGDTLHRVEIDHAPWQLRRAEVEILTNTMALVNGIALPDQAPLAHYVERQDMLNGPPLPATS
jgi:uncharacterized protein YqjF (DUF2071 family)